MLLRMRRVAARRSVEVTLPLRVGALILVTVAENGALAPGAGTESRLLVTSSKMTTTPDGEAGTLFLTGTQAPNEAHYHLSRPCWLTVGCPSQSSRPRYCQLRRVLPVSPPASPISCQRAPCGTHEPCGGQASAARVLRSASALNSCACSVPPRQQEPDAEKDA